MRHQQSSWKIEGNLIVLTNLLFSNDIINQITKLPGHDLAHELFHVIHAILCQSQTTNCHHN